MNDATNLHDTALALYEHLKYVFDKHGVLWGSIDRKQTAQVLRESADALQINGERDEQHQQ